MTRISELNPYGVQKLRDIFKNQEEGKMTVQTKKFIRKPFDIEAIRVTDGNLEAVAEWCKGSVETESNGGGRFTKFVKVDVHHPLTDRQTQAFVGDWVLFSGKGYKVYTNKAFRENFDPAPIPKAPIVNQGTVELTDQEQKDIEDVRAAAITE